MRSALILIDYKLKYIAKYNASQIHLYIEMHRNKEACVFTCITYMHVCSFVSVYSCASMCVCVCVYVCVYICVCIVESEKMKETTKEKKIAMQTMRIRLYVYILNYFYFISFFFSPLPTALSKIAFWSSVAQSKVKVCIIRNHFKYCFIWRREILREKYCCNKKEMNKK